MYVSGKRMTAAGRVISEVTAHIFPATRFESRRHVTKTMPMHMKSLDTFFDSFIIQTPNKKWPPFRSRIKPNEHAGACTVNDQMKSWFYLTTGWHKRTVGR